MLKQISIFAENTKGTMMSITGVLRENDINIWGSVNNDSAEFGIVRMVVSDPQKASEKLTEAGFMNRVENVLGVEMQDEVGNLNTLLAELVDSNVNVDYMYLSFNRDSGKPVIIFHTTDIFEVEICLKNKGLVTV